MLKSAKTYRKYSLKARFIGDYLQAFTESYMHSALWSSAMEDGSSFLDANYDISDISTETQAEMAADCRDFVLSNANDLTFVPTELSIPSVVISGTDFWLTRNRHGAGFWDKGLGARGKRLTANAHAYGEYNLYLGDDGLVHGQ